MDTVTPGAFLTFTKVGVLRSGDRFYYRPPRARIGKWLTARSIGENGKHWWINATTKNGLTRTCSPDHIIRITKEGST